MAQKSRWQWKPLWLLSLACWIGSPNGDVSEARGEEPIPIAKIEHAGPVDFEKEILPVLRRNCLACHSSAKKESNLILETPPAIVKGGDEGAAVVPGKPQESTMLLMASRQRESFMPPDDNNVGAKRLTSEELGLMQLWIEQGAKGEVTGKSKPIQWQPLPAGVNSIFAVALTDDGQFAAAGRANQIFLYHVPSQRELGRLSDPSLVGKGIYSKPGVADLEMIQSLTFSPDGERLVSGGFRTAKIWRRSENVKLAEIAGMASSATVVAISPDGKWAAIGEQSGAIRLVNLTESKIASSLTGHASAVTGLAFSADGQSIYSSSLDKTWRSWKLDGSVGMSIETDAPLNAIALADNGQRIVLAGADNKIRVWLLPPAGVVVPKEPTVTLTGHTQAVSSLSALADGQVLSGSADGTARIWQTRDGKQVREVNHGGPLTSVSSRQDGTKFATASSDHKSVKIWNTADGKMLHELRGDPRVGFQEAIASRAEALSKRLIELASADLKEANDRKVAEEKNATKAEEEKKKADEELAKKNEALNKPTAEKVAAEKALEALKLELAQSELEKKKVDELAAAAPLALAKAKDAALASEVAAKKAAEDFRLAMELIKTEEAKVAEATANQKKVADALAAFTTKLKQSEEAIKNLATSIQKATDEKTAAQRAVETAMRAVERGKQAVLRVADEIPPFEAAVKQKTELQKVAEAKLAEAKQQVIAADRPIQNICFASDNATLAACSADGVIRIYDVESGSPLNQLATQSATASVLAFLADGRLLSAGPVGSATIWQTLPEWTLERTLGNPESPEVFIDRVTAVAVSPDGQLLATGTGEPSRGGEMAMWKLLTGEMLYKLPEAHSDTIFSIDFSRDGERLVSSAADRFVKTFRVSDGKFERAFEGHTHHVLGVAWSADGRLLSSGGADKVVKVWNALTGEQKRTIQGFGKEITAVHFLGDSDQVVACSGDSTVQLLRSNDGGNVRKYAGSSDFVYSVDVSSDGKTIVAGGQDSVVRVWNQDGKELASFKAPAK